MIKKGITPRFAEVGKIKIGGKGEKRKSKDGKEYQIPVRYEHFVVTTTERGNDGNYIIDHALMKKLSDMCGDTEPREIPIRLPFDDIDMNFYTSYRLYIGNKCACKGDGVNAIRTGQDGKEKKVACDIETCEFYKSEKCKVSGVLSCHIPAAMEVGGIYRFRTHSYNSVSSILAALNYFSDNTSGILQGLPLKLKFLKKATQDHGNVNIVTVVLDGIELIRMRELARVEYQTRQQLKIDMRHIENQVRDSGFIEDVDADDDIEPEFQPTMIDDTPGTTADDVAAALSKPDKPVKPEAEQGELL